MCRIQFAILASAAALAACSPRSAGADDERPPKPSQLSSPSDLLVEGVDVTLELLSGETLTGELFAPRYFVLSISGGELEISQATLARITFAGDSGGVAVVDLRNGDRVSGRLVTPGVTIKPQAAAGGTGEQGGALDQDEREIECVKIQRLTVVGAELPEVQERQRPTVPAPQDPAGKDPAAQEPAPQDPASPEESVAPQPRSLAPLYWAPEMPRAAVAPTILPPPAPLYTHPDIYLNYPGVPTWHPVPAPCVCRGS